MATVFEIALAMTPGIGNATCRRLMELCPSAEAIFAMSHSQLVELFGDHHAIIAAIEQRDTMPRAEKELRYMEAKGIRAMFFTDEDYPQRLNREECADSPALLYVLGQADLNVERSVSVVGTRRATAHGRDATDRLVQQLKAYNTTIVSGLAYGIDTAAHTAALEHGLPTVAVLGHGLDRIYPPQNRQLASRLLSAGGALVTEYPAGTDINPGYFPARNRIIAALGDATVVVEASQKGGALITAAIAGSYHRDVFAVPGRLTDTYSAGTNNLIATNRACLLRTADDIALQLGWPVAGQQTVIEGTPPSPQLAPDEERLAGLLRKNITLTLDEIVNLSGMPMPKVAAMLFNLEMNKVVRALPGRLYEFCR